MGLSSTARPSNGAWGGRTSLSSSRPPSKGCTWRGTRPAKRRGFSPRLQQVSMRRGASPRACSESEAETVQTVHPELTLVHPRVEQDPLTQQVVENLSNEFSV